MLNRVKCNFTWAICYPITTLLWGCNSTLEGGQKSLKTNPKGAQRAEGCPDPGGPRVRGCPRSPRAPGGGGGAGSGPGPARPGGEAPTRGRGPAGEGREGRRREEKEEGRREGGGRLGVRRRGRKALPCPHGRGWHRGAVWRPARLRSLAAPRHEEGRRRGPLLAKVKLPEGCCLWKSRRCSAEKPLREPLREPPGAGVPVG